MKLFRTFKTFPEMAEAFLFEKEIEVKKRTHRSHKGKCEDFTAWLNTKGLAGVAMRKITSDHIQDYFISHLSKKRNLDRTTVDKYFLTLRTVWQFAKKRGEVNDVPFDLVVFPAKKEDKGAEVISLPHMKLILAEMMKSDPQLYLASMIQYYCFIRPGTELRFMKVRDIDLEMGTITVITSHAKNGHKRIVTMPQQLIEICLQQGLDKVDKEYYVIGKRKKPGTKNVGINNLSYRFDTIRDRLSMPKGYKFYSFKHTGATALHATNMVSLRELMDQLGHSRLSATEHYVKRHAGTVNNTIRDHFPSPIDEVGPTLRQSKTLTLKTA